MGGILQVDTIQNNNATTLITQTNSTTLTFGVSGQNIVIPSGVTFNTASATINYPAGSISNADINASAAIAYSKLNLSNSIVNADIASSAAIATTKLGTGAVLQVVSATVGQTDLSADGYVGSGASITPSSTSNKILVIVDGYVEKISGTSSDYAETELHRATTLIATLNNATQYQYTVGARMPFSINYLDSPSSTSSTQYRIYHDEQSGGATYRYYQYIITLLEIKA